MSDHARAFLDDVLPRIKAADADLHNGDHAACGAMWSRNEPVTLFGAAFTVAGWNEIRSVFEKLAAAVLGLQLLRDRGAGRRRRSRPWLRRGDSAHDGLHRGTAANYLCATGHNGLSPRGWRVEGCASSRRSLRRQCERTRVPVAQGVMIGELVTILDTLADSRPIRRAGGFVGHDLSRQNGPRELPLPSIGSLSSRRRAPWHA